METQLDELIDGVASSRHRMLASVAGLTEAQASYKPSPEGWSIVEIIEHIVLAEVSGVSKIWQAALSVRAGAPLFPVELHTNRGLTIEQIVDRTWKPREAAPPVATPHIGGPLGFWTAYLASCQTMLERLAPELDGLDLETVVFPHFLCGPLDARQRLDFLRFHSDRHVLQIERIKTRLQQPSLSSPIRAVYRSDDPRLIASLLNGGGAFLEPRVLLEGLTREMACAKPHGLPHSIADIVAHLCYWQEFFNSCLTAGYQGVPSHAAEGWPEPEDWETTQARFLAAIENGKRIVAASGRLNEPLLPAGERNPFLEKDSLGSGILHAGLHNAHHLGQIVMLRQLLGVWPPPAGSLTW